MDSQTAHYLITSALGAIGAGGGAWGAIRVHMAWHRAEIKRAQGAAAAAHEHAEQAHQRINRLQGVKV